MDTIDIFDNDFSQEGYRGGYWAGRTRKALPVLDLSTSFGRTYRKAYDYALAECSAAEADAAQLVAEMSRDDLRDYATERWEEGIQQMPLRWECYTLGGLMSAVDEAVETRCRVEMSGVDYGY